MAESAGNYGEIVEKVYYKDGTFYRVGFHEGKWIAETEHEKAAISKKGFLLYLELDDNGQARSFKMYLDFADMAADDIDLLFLSRVAAAIGADYIQFLDN
jgi:hypothetical protein